MWRKATQKAVQTEYVKAYEQTIAAVQRKAAQSRSERETLEEVVESGEDTCESGQHEEKKGKEKQTKKSKKKNQKKKE